MCLDSLLLLISSIDAAETQQEAAAHRTRAGDAARRVVGAAKASLFASPARLLVLLRCVVAALAILERCVTPVSVSMGGYRCVLDGCDVRAAHGPVGYRWRVCRGRVILS